MNQSENEGGSSQSGFAELGLPPSIVEVLDQVGYESPSPIQARTIPVLLEGRDVVGLAQTGTGKTAAFALPILSRLDPDQRTPQALVLTPTRELALQVAEAFERYAAGQPDVRILAIYGGQGYAVQLAALRRGVQIVVGTPGRIMDHLQRGRLDLSQLRFLVLDEADEMLRMGFVDDVDTILAETPDTKQVALFSATMPTAIRRIAERHLHHPEHITVESKTTAPNISQSYVLVHQSGKLDALTRILEVADFAGVIVFVRTKQATEQLAERLRARGWSAVAINGDIPQPVRERTVQQLKDGQIDILVATDVAARGLDVDRITHVINYDLPTDTEAYVHRIGRTGRAGRAGSSIAFVTPRERHLLRAIERATSQTVTKADMPSVDDVNATRLSRWDAAITAALDSQNVAFYRDVVSHYVREHDVPEVDVAAALAAVLQGDEPLLLDPEAAPQPSRDRHTDDRSNREPRSGRDSRGPRGKRGDMVRYRLSVGKRQHVNPGQIVGALTGDGGLTSGDLGRIDIRVDHSTVEVYGGLDDEVRDALRSTRISGQLIDIRRDEERSAPRQRDYSKSSSKGHHQPSRGRGTGAGKSRKFGDDRRGSKPGSGKRFQSR